jgi:hypothetical protein
MIVNSMSGADFDKMLAGGRDLPLWADEIAATLPTLVF